MTNSDPRSGFPGYPEQSHAAAPSPYPFPGPVPQLARPRRGRRTLASIGAAALAVTLIGSGVAIGRASDSSGGFAFGTISGSGQSDDGSSGASGGQGYFPNGLGTGNGTGSGAGNGSGTQSGDSSAATDEQEAGVVTIVSTLGYQSAASAGTGMILTSNGEILTNNHVVNGAPSITVTDESTGKTYRADVVGTAPTDDIAVLKLRNASGLEPAEVGNASDVSELGVGDGVTGVGNANGTGSLTQVSGKVTALERAITASDEGGANSERLTGLIETDAAIVSGDSGGPLYDTDGDIIGINTAASSGNGSGATSQSYAIPIDDALKIVRQIDSGTETSSVHIGLPAFIGVGVADDDANSAAGAGITSVLEGGPADKAGITAGSTVTAVGGKKISAGTALKTRLSAYEPGQRVAIAWVDRSGARHTATVTLATGPAD